MSFDPAPVKPHSSYRHEAFLHSGDGELVAGLVPFIRDGLAAGQPVMVALPEPHLELVTAALGADAAEVELVDMGELGANPARIIPGWQRFLDRSGGRPARGVGEPIWSGRRSAELVECQLHEALLNLAVDPDTPLWLRCPYDTRALEPEVIVEASRSHPIVVQASTYSGSTAYTGAHHVRGLFSGPLPEPVVPSEGLEFGAEDLAAVRERAIGHAAAAGLDAERVWELGLAVHEVAANSVKHGGGRGLLRVWHDDDGVVCEISDAGILDDPLVGRHRPDPADDGARGLWLANQLCDLVQVRSTDAGAVVRITSWRAGGR